MNLKDFLNSRDKPPELYWSLVMEPGWVQAGIWYIGETSAEVLNISPGAAWETDDELVGAADAALSSCVSKLPENYEEPGKTVFGVPSFWVKDGEIRDEYLAKIKQVCTDLSLTPVGFVVLSEAVAHLYKSEEGAPLSAIVIGLGSDNLEVSVFKLGNLVGTTSVARSISLTDDVTEGLSRFEGASPLPSRMIVFDGKGGELEEAKEELMKANWEDNGKMKFLHTPKAEVLVSDRKVIAVSLAGANEIGDVTAVSSKENTPAEDSYPSGEEIENIKEPDTSTTAEDLGFAINEDVAKNQPNAPEYVPLKAPPVAAVAPPKENLKQASYLQKTRNLFHGFSSKLFARGPKISSQGSKKTIYFVLALVLLFALGGGAYYWFIPKATVTIFVSPKSYQEQINISFSTDGQFDESKAIIPGQVESSQASGDKTKSTTGSKLIGDKATGSVQVVNGNGDPIDLLAGTILTSASGLKFVTNTEASVSGQLIPGSPGTATLSVTAGDLGAQYNLAKGEVFKVGTYDKSQVAATSQADFSGGSSQQIAAVSSDDQKSLENDLKTELTGQIMTDLTNKTSDGQILVNDLASLDVASETFDHKIGDVADTLKLSLSVNGTAILADKAKLNQYVADTMKDKIPQGYALKNSDISYNFKLVGKEGGNYVYTAAINANFLPLINTSDIAREILGKNIPSAVDSLSNVPGYTRAEVILKPSLPGPLKTLPHIEKNINVEVAPDQ